MTSYKRYLIVYLLVSLQAINGSVGCMYDSKHGVTKDGYDYKTLHYVACSCPCEKMRHLARKGKCFKCGHYNKPDTEVFNMTFLYEPSDNPLFPTLRPFKYS